MNPVPATSASTSSVLRRLQTIALGGLALVLAGVATPVLAAAVLKPEVAVTAKVVTVGDMFDGAGALAADPLFLAPAPGTSGLVAIADIRLAAERVGLDDFDAGGATGVSVTRLATTVDGRQLARLISDGLKARGALAAGVTADTQFDAALPDFKAAAVADPVTLSALQYLPDSGLFTARFELAGVADPIELTGHVELMVEAPELTATLAAGTILSASDIAMQRVPLRLAENGNIASIDQLVGKQLQRQSRAGMVLKVSDVADPQLIARNDLVTLYLHVGRLTLTARGTALNAASLGQQVSVLNASSKKVVHGVARADGTVEVSAMPLNVAGL